MDFAESLCGRPGGWPAELRFEQAQNCFRSTLVSTPKMWRRFDTWTMAMLGLVEEEGNAIQFVEMEVGQHVQIAASKFEALKRRVSYLNVINGGRFSMKLSRAGEEIPLYSAHDLLARPEHEIIRRKYKPRTSEHTTTAIEKRFQAFLFGDDSIDGTRTNERLAILGPHFSKIKQKGFGIDREFPTGAFDRVQSEATRILPTEYIDVVTINNRGNLALIELKLDDIQPHVVAQALDYALFFLSYRGELNDVIYDRLGQRVDLNFIDCYIVNNRHHRLFDFAFNYYKPKGKFPLDLWKVTLGATE